MNNGAITTISSSGSGGQYNNKRKTEDEIISDEIRVPDRIYINEAQVDALSQEAMRQGLIERGHVLNPAVFKYEITDINAAIAHMNQYNSARAEHILSALQADLRNIPTPGKLIQIPGPENAPVIVLGYARSPQTAGASDIATDRIIATINANIEGTGGNFYMQNLGKSQSLSSPNS